MTRNDLGTADYERLYRSLRLIRRAEEEIARIYPSDKIKSPVHLSIGQEAVSVGVCDVLRPDDVVAPTYRGHAAFLAKGAPLRGLMAELYGKATGVAGGKGGSMHLIDISHNVLGASAVVGTTIPVAVGLCARPSSACAAIASRWRSSATARPKKASSPKASTSPRCTSCRFCSCARTITTPSTRRSRGAGRRSASASGSRPTASRPIRSTTATCSSCARSPPIRSTRCAAAAARCSSNAAPIAGASTSARARTILRAIARARIWSRGSRATRWKASARGSLPSRRDFDRRGDRTRDRRRRGLRRNQPLPRPRGAVHQCLRLRPASAC